MQLQRHHRVLYTEGRTPEKDMLSLLKATRDVSLDSEELMQKVQDIPSYHNLGVGRSAILRSLDLPPQSKVLELGAGCGAITRALGETFASVLAVEESPIRAEIAAERCRDLPSASVMCADLRSLTLTPDYDIVVLIGVLEHAPVYIFPEETPRNASLQLLKLAKSSLKPNGRLVLAIENRIGLDYWAGAPEPHTGRPYDGLHQYPNPGSQITFTRRELKEILSHSGFSHTAFYFCFPDYHFTRTIFSSIGDERQWFLHNWIEFSLDAPANPRKPTFNKPLAAKALCESGMLREFSNAFLVLAGSSDLGHPKWIAKTFNMRRRRSFRSVTTLYLSPEPHIHKSPLSAADTLPDEGVKDRLTQKTGVADWRPGNLLTFQIERAALGRNFGDFVVTLMDKYHRELREQFETGESDPEGYPLLRPESFDAIPTNVIVTDSGRWHFVDDEMHLASSIPIDFLLYRCMRFCFFRHGVDDRQARKVIRFLYPGYSNSRHKENSVRADALQQQMILRAINQRLLRRSLLWRVTRNDLVRHYLEKVWFRIPPGFRSFVRSRL